MGADVSKNTVAILLVVVILLSIAGTWVALNLTQNLPLMGGAGNAASGEVRVFVEPEPQVSGMTGKVVLEVTG